MLKFTKRPKTPGITLKKKGFFWRELTIYKWFSCCSGWNKRWYVSFLWLCFYVLFWFNFDGWKIVATSTGFFWCVFKRLKILVVIVSLFGNCLILWKWESFGRLFWRNLVLTHFLINSLGPWYTLGNYTVFKNNNTTWYLIWSNLLAVIAIFSKYFMKVSRKWLEEASIFSKLPVYENIHEGFPFSITLKSWL